MLIIVTSSTASSPVQLYGLQHWRYNRMSFIVNWTLKNILLWMSTDILQRHCCFLLHSCQLCDQASDSWKAREHLQLNILTQNAYNIFSHIGESHNTQPFSEYADTEGKQWAKVVYSDRTDSSHWSSVLQSNMLYYTLIWVSVSIRYII